MNSSPFKHWHVSVYLGSGFDIWLHSYFLTGLVQLAQRGEILLSVMHGQSVNRCAALQSAGYPLFLIECSADSARQSRLIAFDPRDQSDAWQTRALNECDYYFKRSFHQLDTMQLEPRYRHKVRPINPMFATWVSAPAWSLRVQTTFLRHAINDLRRGCPVGMTAGVFRRRWHNFHNLSNLSTYEGSLSENKTTAVLFQTRLWDPAEEQGDWVQPCNEARMNMVRVLRNRLGNRLVGGLIRTPYTEKRCPELLSNLTASATAKRPEFIRLCRRFLIRVNIKALFDAIPYSLGETLAANNCLVSETIRNTCATPLVAERHYLSFTTPDECADRCLELLDSPEKTRQLREDAHAYYRAAVSPKEAMRQYLTQALQ
jgi:hypothetical protein